MTAQSTTHVTSLPKTGEDDYAGNLTIGLPVNVLQELAKVNVITAVVAIASEWLAIFGAIALCHFFWHPLLYLVIVMFIGGRQHALAVLQHEAAHYHLLPNRYWNDGVAELLLAWPILLSNQNFRSYHFPHHRYIGTEKDGNRAQYGTHTPAGELRPTWSFPKAKKQFAIWLIIRLFGIGGLVYILRSFRRLLTQGSVSYRLANLFYYVGILSLILWLQGGQLLLLYWFVPLCTWFIFTNILRIAGEHSAIATSDALETSHGFYGLTRTTLPSWFDRIFVVPRHICYHLEHHLYPHVPFYRLPDLHNQLMNLEHFQKQACVTQTYWHTLQELIVYKFVWKIPLSKS
ncbi:MAG: fatty acid desaturase family protein [Cyanobacteria bacterium P01_A01_bin.123]